jgi:hypothetical protein
MKQTVTKSMFTDSFQSIRPDNFSYSGLSALYDYLTDLEDGTGQEIELDVVAICCNFFEYESATSAAGDYGQDFSNEDDALEYLLNNTPVIEHAGGVIIENF